MPRGRRSTWRKHCRQSEVGDEEKASIFIVVSWGRKGKSRVSKFRLASLNELVAQLSVPGYGCCVEEEWHSLGRIL